MGPKLPRHRSLRFKWNRRRLVIRCSLPEWKIELERREKPTEGEIERGINTVMKIVEREAKQI